MLSVIAAKPAVSTEISPGVDYTVYAVSGPNVVYVVSIDRLHEEYGLEVGWPQGLCSFTSRQVTSGIAGLYDDPPGHDVLAAMNGSFFAATPVIIGTAASGGEILEKPDGQYDTFMIGPSRCRPLLRISITPLAR